MPLSLPLFTLSLSPSLSLPLSPSLSLTHACALSLSLTHTHIRYSFYLFLHSNELYSLTPSSRSYERNAADIARLKVLSGEIEELTRTMAQLSEKDDTRVKEAASKRAAEASKRLEEELCRHDAAEEKLAAELESYGS